MKKVQQKYIAAEAAGHIKEGLSPVLAQEPWGQPHICLPLTPSTGLGTGVCPGEMSVDNGMKKEARGAGPLASAQRLWVLFYLTSDRVWRTSFLSWIETQMIRVLCSQVRRLV